MLSVNSDSIRGCSAHVSSDLYCHTKKGSLHCEATETQTVLIMVCNRKPFKGRL